MSTMVSSEKKIGNQGVIVDLPEPVSPTDSIEQAKRSSGTLHPPSCKVFMLILRQMSLALPAKTCFTLRELVSDPTTLLCHV
jgi:hypothetical protein